MGYPWLKTACQSSMLSKNGSLVNFTVLHSNYTLVFFTNIWRKLVCRDLPAHPRHKLDAPRDSVVCLGNIQHPKLTRYGTYKLQKLHTARPTAPATSPASEANPIDARTPSSTATAARGVAHGIVRACARTTGLLRAASACDVAIARTGRATTAMPPRHVRNGTREGRAVRRARRRRRRARRRLAGQEVARCTCRQSCSP